MIPNTVYTTKLFSPSEENLGHKGTSWGRTKSAAANFVVCFISPHLCLCCCWEGCHQSFNPGIPNNLILNILNILHTSMFCLFRYWNPFYLDLNFQHFVLESEFYQTLNIELSLKRRKTNTIQPTFLMFFSPSDVSKTIII